MSASKQVPDIVTSTPIKASRISPFVDHSDDSVICATPKRTQAKSTAERSQTNAPGMDKVTTLLYTMEGVPREDFPAIFPRSDCVSNDRVIPTNDCVEKVVTAKPVKQTSKLHLKGGRANSGPHASRTIQPATPLEAAKRPLKREFQDLSDGDKAFQGRKKAKSATNNSDCEIVAVKQSPRKTKLVNTSHKQKFNTSQPAQKSVKTLKPEQTQEMDCEIIAVQPRNHQDNQTKNRVTPKTKIKVENSSPKTPTNERPDLPWAPRQPITSTHIDLTEMSDESDSDPGDQPIPYLTPASSKRTSHGHGDMHVISPGDTSVSQAAIKNNFENKSPLQSDTLVPKSLESLSSASSPTARLSARAITKNCRTDESAISVASLKPRNIRHQFIRDGVSEIAIQPTLNRLRARIHAGLEVNLATGETYDPSSITLLDRGALGERAMSTELMRRGIKTQVQVDNFWNNLTVEYSRMAGFLFPILSMRVKAQNDFLEESLEQETSLAVKEDKMTPAQQLQLWMQEQANDTSDSETGDEDLDTLLRQQGKVDQSNAAGPTQVPAVNRRAQAEPTKEQPVAPVSQSAGPTQLPAPVDQSPVSRKYNIAPNRGIKAERKLMRAKRLNRFYAQFMKKVKKRDR